MTDINSMEMTDTRTEEAFVFEGPIVCESIPWMDSYFVISKRDHEHMKWYETRGYCKVICLSSRISDCCVEGPADEMLAIANAIEKRTSVSFNRCECIHVEGGFEFSSPRNSKYPVLIPYEFVLPLAENIRDAVANPHLHARVSDRVLPDGEVGKFTGFTKHITSK